MSRVKNTLNTVSKAVSGTSTEFLSKITRLKPNSLSALDKAEIHVESLPQEKESNVSTTPASSDPPSSTSTPPKPKPPEHHSISATTSVNTVLSRGKFKENEPKHNILPVNTSYSIKEEELRSTENKSTSSKSTTALFHPSSFAVSLDETYNYLANHINSYFGSLATTQDKKVDNIDSPVLSQSPRTSDPMLKSDMRDTTTAKIEPHSSKKGFGHYLSYSAPNVQAFVGNYIVPLVPKFRTGESKTASVKEKPVDTQVTQAEPTVSKEQSTTEEKAKKLLLQREKIIARVCVDNRTRALVQALRRASDVRVYINRVEDFSYHLLEFPETRGVAVKEKVIPCLLRLKQASDPGLRAAVREALTLVGYHEPVKGRGIRILSIDGGGLRGLLALQALQKLEYLTGKPIYKLFDYICGVSTGAILGFMLGVFQLPLSDCKDIYRKLGSDVFKQNVIVGTVKMGWSHAFYDSEAWEGILKEKMGSNLLVETSRNPECPKVAAVSTIVNRGALRAYVFRNYNLLPGVRSHYLGGCQHQLWQAIRATSAAPGYFQEFTLGNDLHQDGGLLINNPTALAIHECNCLWPGVPLECVVSLGTGRFENFSKNSSTYTSLKTKITNVISSATDTEEVHAMLDAFMPADTYFRFNPYVSEDINMDDSRQEKLNLLQAEGLRYLERNEEKLKKVTRILAKEKQPVQKLADWTRLRADMYNGLSLYSSKP
ncbi:calcium-independent phospholipase A2-gamma-like isoform X2 [Cynoglossus semilaevis]|nr:calcium-independent phospholipase A2-gamma-like isoform X2 [Cynoglossus semilaevis]XP_024912014.1 calcium-independent phospholipase A2-gamma-like isoform X2 [Cynoglossus semilaevis]